VVLAALLPGLRDFRTPFVTGALYAVALWLAFGGDRLRPDKHPDDKAMERLTSLADLIGPHATLAATGLGVFLLGSLLTRESPFPFPIGQMYTAEVGGERPWSYDFDRWLSEQVDGRSARLPDGLSAPPGWTNPRPPLQQAFMEGFEHDRPEGKDQEPFAYRVVNALRYAVRISLENEFEDLVVRLQIERESLFNDYDRLRSEAQLRFSIAPPMVLIVIVLAVVGHPLWLLGVVAPGWFYFRGLRVYQQARLRVWQAVKSNVISSSATLHELDEFFASLPPK
jgi:hypothetical protein